MSFRMHRTPALAVSLFGLLMTSHATAQQGPAELWVWSSGGGGGGSNTLFEFDETGPTLGASVFTSTVDQSPAVEYIGGAFVLTESTNSPPGVVEVWNANTGLIISSVNLDFSLSSSAADYDTVTAMEYVGGTLYAVNAARGDGSEPSEFGTLDPLTGVFTPIGLTNSTGGEPLGGLAFDGTTMYASGGAGADETLYTVNLTTGALTVVGSTGERLTSIQFGADGVLYGLDGVSDALGTIDPNTAAFTPIGDVSGLAGGLNSLTSTFIVPEPASATLLALGGLMLTMRGRRKGTTRGASR